MFAPPLAGLASIPVDGCYQTVDVAGFEPPASKPDDFISRHGASQRLEQEFSVERVGGVSALQRMPPFSR